MALDRATDHIRATIICSLLLWLKVLASNVYLGKTKSAAGNRAKEDKYQNEETSDEAQEAQDRAQRIVSNDTENIPFVMALAGLTSFCIFTKIAYVRSQDDSDDIQTLGTLHFVFYCVFTFFRFAHTGAYFMGLSSVRSLAYAISVLASIGIAVIGIIAAFSLGFEDGAGYDGDN